MQVGTLNVFGTERVPVHGSQRHKEDDERQSTRDGGESGRALEAGFPGAGETT